MRYHMMANKTPRQQHKRKPLTGSSTKLQHHFRESKMQIKLTIERSLRKRGKHGLLRPHRTDGKGSAATWHQLAQGPKSD